MSICPLFQLFVYFWLVHFLFTWSQEQSFNTSGTLEKLLNTNPCLIKVHEWKGVKNNDSNIAPLGNIVTISTLLSLYRWSVNGEHVVSVHINNAMLLIGKKQYMQTIWCRWNFELMNWWETGAGSFSQLGKKVSFNREMSNRLTTQ